MSNAVVQDVLKELDKRELAQMLTVLKRHLPQQIRAHNYILNYLIHYDRIMDRYVNGRSKIYSSRWKLRFYGHRNGKLENCTFVSLTAIGDYCITVFTLEETAEELAECLQHTNRIDWDVQPFALGVDVTNFNVVNDIVRTKRNDWLYDPIEYIMYIPKEKVMKLEYPIIPDDMCIKPLDASFAKIINDNWPHKYNGSYALIKQSIETNGGVALLRNSGGNSMEPVAWIATSDFFTPGFLHTIPAQRRKGYGRMVFVHELKRLVKQHNVDLFTFVVCNNKASVDLHRQLGFHTVNKLQWIVR